MKKFLSLILAVLFVFALSACTSETASYNIGIIEYSNHTAQNKAVQGFTDVLTEKLGDDVSFDRQNASNDASTCTLIANSFVSQGVDLILADNTQSLQVASASTWDIPILGAAVTDYSAALGTATPSGVTGINVSGTSDLPPLESQAEMILELFPDATTVGLIYCSSEVNSLYQINIVQQYLVSKGINCVEYPFTDANDLFLSVESACEFSDVIYLPTDNTIASCSEIVDNICRPAGTPVIAGEEAICSACGVATLSVDYYELGRKTGEMAYRILKEDAVVSQMPIEYDDVFTKKYNVEIATELGVTIPEDYIAIN